MGRKPQYQEFLLTLRKVTGLSLGAFAKECGKQYTDMSQYLTGNKPPGKAVVASVVSHLRDGWAVTPVMEVEPIPSPLTILPTNPGIYVLYDSGASVIYLGQATNLRSEIYQTLGRATIFAVRRGPKISTKAHPKYKVLAKYMSAYIVESSRLRHNLEALLLRGFPNHAHNNKMGKFK